MPKAMTGIGIIKKLSKTLPWHSLITIYKSFVRPHLDHGDIIYDQPYKQSLDQKIKWIQCNTALAITGAIKEMSQSKLYNKLGFESLKLAHWFRKLFTFYKIKTTGIPEHPFYLIHETNHIYNTLSSDNVSTFYSRTDVCKYSFFPYTILEWKKLDKNIRQSKTIMFFRNSLLKSDQSTPKLVYNTHKPTGLKLLTRLRLGLSLIMISETVWIPYDPVVWRLSLLPIFFLYCHYHIDIWKPSFMNNNQLMRIF